MTNAFFHFSETKTHDSPLWNLANAMEEKTTDIKSLDKSIVKEISELGKPGLTEAEKCKLKDETNWPDEIINVISSNEEAEIYKKSGLVASEINGKPCLIREDLDINQKDEFGYTNKERMENGHPPLTKNGEVVELHHIGQKPDSPLAELTMQEHRGKGNDVVLHNKQKETEIDRAEFKNEREEHWADRADLQNKGGKV